MSSKIIDHNGLQWQKSTPARSTLDKPMKVKNTIKKLHKANLMTWRRLESCESTNMYVKPYAFQWCDERDNKHQGSHTYQKAANESLSQLTSLRHSALQGYTRQVKGPNGRATVQSRRPWGSTQTASHRHNRVQYPCRCGHVTGIETWDVAHVSAMVSRENMARLSSENGSAPKWFVNNSIWKDGKDHSTNNWDNTTTGNHTQHKHRENETMKFNHYNYKKPQVTDEKRTKKRITCPAGETRGC